MGFIATWFFAASPIKRSLSENETYDGVVPDNLRKKKLEMAYIYQEATYE